MSDLNDFLKAAKGEVTAAQFERDVAAGLISEVEYGSRLRFVGNPEAPLAVQVGFKTIEAWEVYCAMMPTEPPVIHEVEQTSMGWIEIE